MVDDGDVAGILVPQDQVGNANKTIAADVQLKSVLNGKDFVLIAKAVEGFEIPEAFVVIPACQPAGKRREVFLDGFIVLGGVDVGQLKGHELAFGPAFEDAVAVGAIGGVGVLNLRQLVDVLQLERLRALIVELQLREAELHIVRNDAHDDRLLKRAVCFRTCERRIPAGCPRAGWAGRFRLYPMKSG